MRRFCPLLTAVLTLLVASSAVAQWRLDCEGCARHPGHLPMAYGGESDCGVAAGGGCHPCCHSCFPCIHRVLVGVGRAVGHTVVRTLDCLLPCHHSGGCDPYCAPRSQRCTYGGRYGTEHGHDGCDSSVMGGESMEMIEGEVTPELPTAPPVEVDEAPAMPKQDARRPGGSDLRRAAHPQSRLKSPTTSGSQWRRARAPEPAGGPRTALRDPAQPQEFRPTAAKSLSAANLGTVRSQVQQAGAVAPTRSKPPVNPLRSR